MRRPGREGGSPAGAAWPSCSSGRMEGPGRARGRLSPRQKFRGVQEVAQQPQGGPRTSYFAFLGPLWGESPGGMRSFLAMQCCSKAAGASEVALWYTEISFWSIADFPTIHAYLPKVDKIVT